VLAAPMRSDVSGSLKSLTQKFLTITLGPWPIRPIPLMFLTLVALGFGQTMSSLDYVLTGGTRLVWVEQAPRLILVAFLVTAPLWITEFLRRVIVDKPLTRVWYLASLVVSSLIYPFITFSMFSSQSLNVSQNLDLFVIASLRWLLVQWLVFGILGLGQRRLSQQVDRANEAKAAVLSQQELLVRSEEAARRSVADFLHDRVQSMMVTSTMQLREIAQRTDDQSGAELRSVAEHLDDLRTTEVRAANKRLSPNIAVMGLESAICDLLASLSGEIESDVFLEPSLRDWAAPKSSVDLVPIGVFRIIEQVAANSVIHGHASRIDVRIHGKGNGVIVHILDDGTGLQSGMVSGSGTAIIETWAGILGATWTRRDRPDGGVEVVVRVPLHRASD